MPTATQTIDSLITFSCESGASDLHVDPMESVLSVRVRIDGNLVALAPLPKTLHAELIARLKVLSGLRTDEHFVPQDGRFRYEYGTASVDIRLSIVPTYYGENVVLRFLNRTQGDADLAGLGLSDVQEQSLVETLSRTHGMLLVTGPTGSGKTTTLYALMRLLLARPVSLVTIEDPIEYSLDGAVQIPVRSGCTFANGLRSILRQDPDIIMVGEIRDAETAALAVHAALTGHLVFSTLHTNDSASALTRLMDLKLEPYLIASTVALILAQRLVRKVCTACAVERKTSEAEQHRVSGILGASLPEWVSHGRGCAECNGSGYRGRTGVYELLEMAPEIADAVLSNASSRNLRSLALEQGMQPLMLDGLGKIASGITTIEEILRLRHA